MPVIDEVVAKIEDWKRKRVTIQQLSGGLTKSNFKVQVNGNPFFVRVPGESTELLAIHRRNEYFNSKAAAESGVGPQVFYYLGEYQAMVLEFLNAKTMSEETLNATGMPAKIARAIKRRHAGPRFLNDFNRFRLTEYYLSICKEYDVRIPEGYLERVTTVKRIEQAMAVLPLATVPCNNDLLAENYMDDGKSLRIIDYEYSGNKIHASSWEIPVRNSSLMKARSSRCAPRISATLRSIEFRA